MKKCSMKASDALKEIIAQQGLSQRSVALKIGLSPQALSSRMSGTSMRVSTLSEIAEALGYRIELVANDSNSQGYHIFE